MNYVEAAKKAAKEAGEMLLQYQGKEKHVHFKAHRDIATKADKDSETLLHKILIEDGFPEHDFLSEESDFKGGSADYRWIVDPIDGTGNFAHENPLFCVSVGLQHKNEVIAGAIYCPTMDEMFSAEKGKGAFLNGKQVHCSKQDKFFDLLLALEMPPKENIIRRTLLIEKNFALHHRVRTLGSSALDLAYIACGRFDAFISAYLYAWDVAAGIVIAHEAGGEATHHNGKQVDLNSIHFDFAASNGILHKQLIEKIKA
ncbi:MAG: inositol monophosphatase family protein [Candidatus Micrarchaeota archaeon]